MQLNKTPVLTLITFILLIALTLTACQSHNTHVFEGFDGYQRPIQTKSKTAQRCFSQGMQFLYGFNHDQAIVSFQKAARHDPKSPMPYWGIAHANGININDRVMNEQRSIDARAAADQALARIHNGSPAEQALVRAIDARYAHDIPNDRLHLDQAYANAMADVYLQFPNDPDIAALYAESMMNLQPWDYWLNSGLPKGQILQIVRVLESALDAHPQHPGANHFYIHAVEASQNPDRAAPAADRLSELPLGAGHLIHMPSHIYVRVGRYTDAVTSNTLAVAADRNYFKNAPEQHLYNVYYAHNLHFLAYAAMMSGQYEKAITAARALEAEIPEQALRDFAPLIEGIMPTTLHVMIRFGKWEQVLQEPPYPEWRLVSRAVYHYARSIACSALGRTEQARDELNAFQQKASEIPPDWYVFENRISDVMPIANAMIRGELLYREGKKQQAYDTLYRGINAEDDLVYDEPPGWMLPVRHALGALLMADQKFTEAEDIYREDLQRNRNNGWSLLGLQQALIAQGKNKQAKQITPALNAAWINADTDPTSSCYCEPKYSSP